MDIKEKIAQANEKTVHMLMDSDPVWVDMKPAIECVDGLEDHMILHSGPPIAYEDMTMLHKRGMVSAMLFEGWAKDEEEAVKRLKAGEIKISSALDHNTVGAGTGIITKSVVLNVVEDRHNHTVAATFPAEGPFQGGFCGWGLYVYAYNDSVLFKGAGKQNRRRRYGAVEQLGHDTSDARLFYRKYSIVYTIWAFVSTGF